MAVHKITLRHTVLLVALLNLAYFGIEFSVAVTIQSVSLFADSIDFLEDTSINLLIFFALAWTARKRARVGMFLAAVLLIPGIATVWAAWQKLGHQVPPDSTLLFLTGFGALFINISCALLLARFKSQGGSLSKAAFLSSRNDALANIAIIIAALVTAVIYSPWPDLIVGIGIFLMNIDAAYEVFTEARKEYSGEHLPSE